MRALRPAIGLPPALGCPGLGSVNEKGLLVDGDMEAVGTAAWTAVGGVALSKQGGAVRGAQCLRITRSSYGYAQQAVTVVGGVYRIKGYGRGDGTVVPIFYDAGSSPVWTGSNSNVWQYFDKTYTAIGTTAVLFPNGTGYIEWDELILKRIG